MTRSAASSSPKQRRPSRQRSRRGHRRQLKRWQPTPFRAFLVWSLLVFGIGALTARLANLQLQQGTSLTQMARQQQYLPKIQRQARRPVVDRQNNVLAADRMVYTLYAHPLLFQAAKADIARELAAILEKPSDELLTQFNQQETGIQVAVDIPEEMADHVRDLGLDGLELLPKQQRFYPQQELFAPLVGFVNLEGVPQTGIEAAFQEELLVPPEPARAPKQAAESAETPEPAEASETAPTSASAPNDSPTADSLTADSPTTDSPTVDSSTAGSTSANSPAADAIAMTSSTEETAETAETSEQPAHSEAISPLRLQLTLDSRLQRVAQQELQNTVQKHGAKRGTAMVMDAHTGEILAFAIVPTFDPNRYYEADVSAFKNWAVSDLYEPGSTFKPLNVAIALEVGALRPDDTIYDEGRLIFGPWTIQNADYSSAGGRGPLSITEVMKYSSNVGMVHIMERVRSATYFDWLQRLGLGRPTGIDVPSEVAGQLKDRDQFVNSAVESATTAFGQGFSLTPIQLLQLQGVLANGGKLVTPHLVKGLVDEQGNLQWQPDRPTPQTLFSEETTQAVLAMMEKVVEEGTGKVARTNGYRIAGKTGTAQKVLEGGGYGSGRITSFVGILPVEAPRYVVLAVIDEPQGDNAYGSTVAAPLVKKIIDSLVVIEGIPPANLAATKDTQGTSTPNASTNE